MTPTSNVRTKNFSLDFNSKKMKVRQNLGEQLFKQTNRQIHKHTKKYTHTHTNTKHTHTHKRITCNTERFAQFPNRYKFSCQNPGFETVHTTNVNDLDLWVDWITNPWGSGNVPFLDRLPVDCQDDGLLSAFQV